VKVLCDINATRRLGNLNVSWVQYVKKVIDVSSILPGDDSKTGVASCTGIQDRSTSFMLPVLGKFDVMVAIC
jgi:hypothetical protein